MELLEIIDKFNYKNIVIVDDEDFVNPTISSYIDETSPVYENLVTEYGFETIDKRISECDSKIIDIIANYIDNPYKGIISIKDNVNFVYENIFSKITCDRLLDGNTIWFVDIKVDNSRKYHHISYLYDLFHNRNKNNGRKDLFILFSNEASCYDSLDKVNEFFKEKVEITFDDEFSVDLNTNFVEKSKDITASLIYELILKGSKSEYFDLLNKCIKSTINNYKKSIYNSDMNLNLFHYDYLTEGQPFDEILYGVFLEELKNKYNESLNYSIFSYMNDVIDFYLDSLDKELLFEKIMWRIARVINDYEHPTLIDTTINILRHDLCFGDIFSISSKYYMLANQMCDLTIRETGERVDPNAFLIPIELKKITNVSKCKQEVISYIIDKEIKDEQPKLELIKRVEKKYKVVYNGEKTQQPLSLVKYTDKIYAIKYKSKSSFVALPFWCMDNVCCNDDGLIDFNFCSDGLRYPLKLRVKNAEKAYSGVKEKLNNGISIEEFISIAFMNSNSKFKIKRIGKLNFEFANEIYREFVNNQTRIANKSVLKI